MLNMSLLVYSLLQNKGTSKYPYGCSSSLGSYTLPSGVAPRKGNYVFMKIPQGLTTIQNDHDAVGNQYVLVWLTFHC